MCVCVCVCVSDMMIMITCRWSTEINQGLGIEVDVAVDPELDANRIITIQGLPPPLELSEGLVTNPLIIPRFLPNPPKIMPNAKFIPN